MHVCKNASHICSKAITKFWCNMTKYFVLGNDKDFTGRLDSLPQIVPKAQFLTSHRTCSKTHDGKVDF